jgi:tetratricopeptide (TPR) repeat protein
VLGLVAYHNSFSAAFVFDDTRWIEHGRRIREDLWPLSPFFSGTLRPLLFYTLAVNYRLGGLDVTGYHVFNVTVHLLAAVTLYDLMRLTFQRPCFRGRYAASATWLAFAVAAVWVVHPLQTQGVNYVIQRGESMASLCMLFCLYGMVRAQESQRPWGWYALVVVAGWLGMGAKEIMITAPVLMYLYDRTFLSGTWRGPLWRRWWLYAAVAPAWLWLASGGIRGAQSAVRASSIAAKSQADVLSGAAGPKQVDGVAAKPQQPTRSEMPTPLEYARTQPAVILHYLRLVVWPNPLCMDYRWPVAAVDEAVVPTAILLVLLASSLWALSARPALGFVACSFFLILAPTSSILPIRDLAFEHRMYLASAAVIILLVFAVRWLFKSLVARTTWKPQSVNYLLAGLLFVAMLMLTTGTIARNRDYQSQLTMWESIVEVRPTNVRALNNLAQLYFDAGRRDDAVRLLEQAARLQAGDAHTEAIVGLMLLKDGRVEAAVLRMQRAIERWPGVATLHLNLGAAYEQLGQWDEAIFQFRQAAKYAPGMAAAQKNLGHALVQSGKIDDGITAYREALRLDPGFFDAHINLGAALAGRGQLDDAIRHFEQALALGPDEILAHENLAQAYADAARYADAIRVLASAVELARRSGNLELQAVLQARVEGYKQKLRQP